MKQRKRRITDKQRLDWIQRNDFDVWRYRGLWWCVFREIRPEHCGYKSARQAIDAAIRDGKEV